MAFLQGVYAIVAPHPPPQKKKKDGLSLKYCQIDVVIINICKPILMRLAILLVSLVVTKYLKTKIMLHFQNLNVFCNY